MLSDARLFSLSLSLCNHLPSVPQVLTRQDIQGEHDSVLPSGASPSKSRQTHIGACSAGEKCTEGACRRCDRPAWVSPLGGDCLQPVSRGLVSQVPDPLSWRPSCHAGCLALRFQSEYLFDLFSCWFILAGLELRCFPLCGWLRLSLCVLRDCSSLTVVLLGWGWILWLFIFGFLCYKELLGLLFFFFF